MKLGEPGETIGNLFGFPIVVSESVPKGEIVLGPSLPTHDEMLNDGCASLEEWITKHAKEFGVIENIGEAK